MHELATVGALLGDDLFQIALEVHSERKAEVKGGVADDFLEFKRKKIGGGFVGIDKSAFQIQHIDGIGRC